MTREEMAWLYDAVLSVPAMEEKVKKLSLQPSRKLVLILSQVIDKAIEVKKGEGSGLLSFYPEQIEGLKELRKDLLDQAELTVFADKLKGVPGNT